MDLTKRVVRKAGLLSASIGDEVVILSTQKGMYYGTQSVGERIWSILQTPTHVADLRDRVMEEFEVDQVTCERDVLAFLDQLAREGLINVM